MTNPLMERDTKTNTIVTGVDYDPGHNRVFIMWSDGVNQHRDNYLMCEGAEIPMHSHSYDHDYKLGVGTYALTVESPEGVKEPEIILDGGSTGHVPKWWRHHFRLIKWGGEPGKVGCYWPIGADQ